MTTAKDGGPAFPIVGEQRNVLGIGMTLRDYFAASALAGLVSKPGGIDVAYEAKAAYRYADALLAEREKGGAA